MSMPYPEDATLFDVADAIAEHKAYIEHSLDCYSGPDITPYISLSRVIIEAERLSESPTLLEGVLESPKVSDESYSALVLSAVKEVLTRYVEGEEDLVIGRQDEVTVPFDEVFSIILRFHNPNCGTGDEGDAR